MSSLTDMASKEGGYQPIIIKGEQVTEGWRESYKRWEYIKPYLNDYNGLTIVDIGSHYGYFTLQAALTNGLKNFVWSIEENAERAEIQRQMLVANGPQNAVLSQHKWTIGTTEKLLQSHFRADVILLLSVGHYFDRATMPQMFANLAKLAQTLIIEWPSLEELEVASRDLIQNTDINKLLGDNYEHIEVIGEGRSPKDKNINREIYRASNDTIYFATNENRVHSYQYPGISIEDLRPYGMAYPSPMGALSAAADCYEDLIKDRKGRVTDINIRNVLMSSNGVQLIDFEEGLDRPFIYDMPMAAYIARTLSWDAPEILAQFIEMWAGTWKP